MAHKSRNQSLFDFLECLQLEYITAELRSKIYPSSNDKKYYRKVMRYKREKIEDIAQRNDLPTIFSSKDGKANEMYKQVYAKFGVPSFQYKDTADREKFEYNDLINYFIVDAEVKVLREDGDVDVAIIVDNESLEVAWNDGDDDFSKVAIAVRKRKTNTTEVVLIEQLSRIL